MSLKKKILFIIGSVNQTSQMHQISALLPEYDAYFTQFFGDHPIINWGVRTGLTDATILGGKFKRDSDAYLADHGLRSDYQGKMHGDSYELVVACSDLLVPGLARRKKSIWVQEGMVDPVTRWSKAVQKLGLPRWFTVGTSLNGSSNLIDIYCVASQGYRDFFTRMGTDREKLFVTGIPNFDNIAQHTDNDFPYRDYVLVATSDMRETYRNEDRPAFIRKAVEIAAGRQLIFKLHPNEDFSRATEEIEAHAPGGTLIYRTGNSNAMVANCEELITQYSTLSYVGLALGKPVHSFFDVEELKRLLPVQNGGTSAENIADICRKFIAFNGPKTEFAAELAQTFVPVATPRQLVRVGER